MTLKRLAKHLNVSIATVSKSLNDSPEISERTKQRVKDFAVKVNYVPNEFAQSLKGKKSKTIGVIIPNVLAHFFAKSLHSIETEASRLGFKIIVCLSNESQKKEAESIKTLIHGNVDGIIVSLAEETQKTQNFRHFSKALDYNIPIVLFDRISENLFCDKITINDEESAETATNELIASGCKNILFLSTIHSTSVGTEREKGYKRALQQQNFTPKIIHLSGQEQLQEQLPLLLKQQTIDGILAADELSAVASMRMALINGFKIPEEISVIGFTNGILGANYIPSLTAVDQKADKQGIMALETMVKRIESKLSSEPVHQIIETSIIHRESTRNIER